MDADLSHPPAYLPALISCLRDDDSVDVVIASRYVTGGQILGWPRHRRWMSRLVNRFARSWFVLPSRDCSGSFRCYRVSALRKMGIERLVSRGYAFYEEILWRLRIANAKMVEVPYTFQDRTKGETKLNLMESLRGIGTLITLRWR
jgi:dolichol-phosphate mannosyltransferase